jgi:hypothetical protein
MRIVRIVLQIIIVAMGGILLSAMIVSPKTGFVSIVIAFLFFAILFAMTLWLKYVTEKRLSQEKSIRSNTSVEPRNSVDTSTLQLRKAYVRKMRRSLWLFPFIYIFFSIIPIYYEYKTEIPPDDALNKTDGKFLYRHIGKGGYIVEMFDGGGKHSFTCRKNIFLGNSHSCLFIKGDDFSPFNGKAATVWWFDQEIYPFIHQQRLVRLVVNDHELVSRAETIASAENSISVAPWFSLVFLVFMILFAYYVEFHFLRSIENHEHEHC